VPNLHVAPHAAFTQSRTAPPRGRHRRSVTAHCGICTTGSRHDVDEPVMMITPVDGTATIALPQVDAATAQSAVAAAADAHRDWSTT